MGGAVTSADESGGAAPVGTTTERPVQDAVETTPRTSPARNDAVVLETPTPHSPEAGAAGMTLIGPEHYVIEIAAGATLSGAGLARVTGGIPNQVTVAIDFGKAGSGWAGPLVFSTWLRRQLRERRISQRQLAMLAGVNHSTVSRVVTGGRVPSLETATRIVRALRMEWSDEQVATFFELLPEHGILPTQRVETALRGDGTLIDGDVESVMRIYLAIRARRRRTMKHETETG
jgi:transcriptional regulator with XRE-family HTH domain